MSDIIAVRVSKELKRKLRELNIKYSEEVRRFLEELVRREEVRRAISRALEIRRKIKRIEGNLAVEFVREDRDGR